ncbi:helix-turn-helix transcriptional regulator [Nonomuraea dietziae]|uniref:response regulator transcription factor n=1 Tax=Nonomuraea dietziae TaxID=65515 RepID=UPI0031D95857
MVRAAESFERLGARGWAERAQAELRSSGAPARASLSYLTALTWQERRIAELAASGLTNKEIGARMHLSPRTVSSHLYRVFPKLGVTSRGRAARRSGQDRRRWRCVSPLHHFDGSARTPCSASQTST